MSTSIGTTEPTVDPVTGETLDVVEEAGIESFPASDPPAFGALGDPVVADETTPPDGATPEATPPSGVASQPRAGASGPSPPI